MTAEFRPCAVVPSRDHWERTPGVVAGLHALGLPVFIVDDGSGEPARSILRHLHDPRNGGGFHRFESNRGKGAAVMQGMLMAMAAGYTHAAQVDADGQHDLAALPHLLSIARARPDVLASGVATYDRSVPLGRSIGRWVTHAWVWIETLSFAIRDSMCGFRVYPLAAVHALASDGEHVGSGMDFDTEIMVRLAWRGVPVIEHPVHVTYPPGNLSNFRMLQDNWRISAMHARLFFGMLRRLPQLLARQRASSGIPGDAPHHWALLAERGALWGLRFSAVAYRVLGRRACLAVLAPIVGYFYLTGREQRRSSAEFLARAFAASGNARRPTLGDGFKHFMAFAGRAVDTFAAWTGGIAPHTVRVAGDSPLRKLVAGKGGALLIVSHVGNVDVSRAVLNEEERRRMLVLVHTKHAFLYNRVLQLYRPDAAMNTLQVTELGPETAIALKDHVEGGGWVVIAGDRTSVSDVHRVSRVPFLGAEASFSHGPHILAALLECPAYFLTCLRVGAGFELDATLLAERVELPRGQRTRALDEQARAFAALLQAHALRDPFQWFNFFDFWARRDDESKA